MEHIKKKFELFPDIRGALTENAPLGLESWFGCGGAADLLFAPADAEDLAAFLSSCCHPERSEGSIEPSSQTPQDDIIVIGGLANTIIRDGGIRGVTIRLGKPFAQVEVLDETRIRAGAGALNGNVAAAAVRAGIGGLEFLSGIPGTVGGALAMNAGAYGAEVKDALVEVEALDRQGRLRRFTPEDLRMTYRHTDIPDGTVFTACILRGAAEDYKTVKTRMNEIKARRNATQPIREKTGGSTFANPTAEECAAAGLPEGTRAWQLVERVGGRGLRVGRAQMSPQHCNFMINIGNATAADLEALGEELRRRVAVECGLDLRWEIKRAGDVI